MNVNLKSLCHTQRFSGVASISKILRAPPKVLLKKITLIFVDYNTIRRLLCASSTNVVAVHSGLLMNGL